MPIVTGDQLSWSVVSAKTINVHRGDGSYVESLPGSATSWTAPVPGDYYLVAANREHWSSWPKSETVIVGSSSTVPMPIVTGDQLSWPVVSAKTINVHRGDGSYVESLPGSATSWTAPAPGDYFLVAANTEHWSSWLKSETVTVGSGNITMPGSLSATVHSSHEIELLWTPSTDDGLVMGYDIFRDGVLIKEQLDAISFSDAMLEPATTYHYSVVAVDNDGNRSNPSNVEATTLDGPPLPAVITVDNHVELLRHVFDIYRGNAYFADLDTLPDWSDPAYAGLPDPFSVETSITCLNGGTALFTPYASVGSGADLRWDFEFDNCQDDSSVIDGQLKRSLGATSFGTVRGVSSERLSIVGQSTQVYFSGRVREERSNYHSRSASDVYYSASDELISFKLSDANTVVWEHAYSAGMSGGFTVRSEITGNRALHAEVIEELRSGTTEFLIGLNWTYQIGKLELTGDDGSKLVLNADNGDHASVTLVITAPTDDNETLIQPWTLWEDNIRLEGPVLNFF